MSVPESWVRIGPNRYGCRDAFVVCSIGEAGLNMELYSFDPLTADDEFFNQNGGMTINGVLWPGVFDPGDLVGQSLRLTSDDDGDLAESVFWEKSNTLEIHRLVVECPNHVDGILTVRVSASLAGPGGQELDAEGVLVASVGLK